MKILIALGGNALLQRGQELNAKNQLINIKIAAESIAKIAMQHQIILTHGNGPQVGMLALDKSQSSFSFDVLDAETEGMIGYLLERELRNILGIYYPIATILTQVIVDKNDIAFQNPTKFIGGIYDKDEAQKCTIENNWVMKQDGQAYRRVIASPKPQEILQLPIIKSLIAQENFVICGGGGGIPIIIEENNQIKGIEAVIDKDLCSSLLASKLSVDAFVIATDVAGIMENFGTDNARIISQINYQDLQLMTLPAGSMAPKAQAAINFVQSTRKPAFIGNLSELSAILKNKAGTRVEYE